MHILSPSPVMADKKHPLPKSGCSWLMVAGTCFVPEWNRNSVTVTRWSCHGKINEAKQLKRVEAGPPCSSFRPRASAVIATNCVKALSLLRMIT